MRTREQIICLQSEQVVVEERLRRTSETIRAAGAVGAEADEQARLIQPLPPPALSLELKSPALPMLDARVLCLLCRRALAPLASASNALCVRIEQSRALEGHNEELPERAVVHSVNSFL
eukprot:CAMPEP_0183353492 /NCGR_PEP_ID=MMETSP0164_2-20130417/33283_1 /TAXON_ID=221442 /ORGANISM="Coccolithus pelagicus ssp braarudi, Strain PLY182g" /LENGTH=118 /DNA_ID=CAMNT_0025526167 /DNA_START=285 /DNA_END=640 /DNA_ORIENTATION=+